MMCKRAQKRGAAAETFFVSAKCHPQTIDTVKVRAEPLGYQVIVGDHETYRPDSDTFGILLQYPDTEGTIADFRNLVEEAHAAGALVVVATRPPGPHPADAPRRLGRRYRRRQRPTLRRTNGLRRPPRCLHGHPRPAQTADARPPRRRLPGRPRQNGSPPRPPDQRATYPSRQGHQQHLHRPGPCSQLWPRCMPSTMAPPASQESPNGFSS